MKDRNIPAEGSFAFRMIAASDKYFALRELETCDSFRLPIDHPRRLAAISALHDAIERKNSSEFGEAGGCSCTTGE